jgi:hypothetical protein
MHELKLAYSRRNAQRYGQSRQDKNQQRHEQHAADDHGPYSVPQLAGSFTAQAKSQSDEQADQKDPNR